MSCIVQGIPSRNATDFFLAMSGNSGGSYRDRREDLFIYKGAALIGPALLERLAAQ
jgi:hypothetical protein